MRDTMRKVIYLSLVALIAGAIMVSTAGCEKKSAAQRETERSRPAQRQLDKSLTEDM